ncbi:MAG: class I SAM-dependent methyltransferase [Actinobacteria bacterium]|nr:MAG: class I SAM-dependent methyltransferase [Actinomycetota bacterium]
MQSLFLDVLRCPACLTDRAFDLVGPRSDEREIREAILRCRQCGHEGHVQAGIVDLMHQPPEFVLREAQGLERFAAEMRSDGWDKEAVLALPYRQDGYWYAQATAMHQALHQHPFGPGQRLLDVGSNTCWASATFARERDLDVVALDISAAPLQGLATAQWWMDAHPIFLERLRSLMFAPALASEAFDWVWCCEVLHHNHRENLERTLAELFRVLKPGGRLIAVNETVRSLRHPGVRGQGAVERVEEWAGYEHSYLRRTYLRAARRAGFEVAVKGPWYLPAFEQGMIEISPEMSIAQGLRAALAHALRRMPRVRMRYLTWKTYVTGAAALFFVATKPGSSASPPTPGAVAPADRELDRAARTEP